MTPAVFFDLDGVLADFFFGSLKRHGRTMPARSMGWNFWRQIGLSDEEFWAKIDRDFWASLDPLADGFELLRAAEEMLPANRVGLLTAATGADGCIDGKREWVAKHLPEYLPRLFTGAAKELFAAPNKVLVDDSNANVTKFAAAGGWVVCIPRPWNHRGRYCDDRGAFPVKQLAAELRIILRAASDSVVVS